MREINWSYCQRNSDAVLADGLDLLLASPALDWREINTSNQGNYIISCGDKLYYIGEAKNIKNRIRQQFRRNTSTFYRNYLKQIATDSPLEIDDFKVRYIEARIGRKEIEEFGIATLPNLLNVAQKGVRSAVTVEKSSGLWNFVQDRASELLDDGQTAFFHEGDMDWLAAKPRATPCNYRVLNKECCLIYIGESGNFRRRFGFHGNTKRSTALRRHVGTEIMGLSLVDRKKFGPKNDQLVTDFLHSCRVAFIESDFGRLELEEALIRNYKPQLNRKDNPEYAS